MDVWAATTSVSMSTPKRLLVRTVSMSMRFDSKAQNPEAVIPYRIVLDSCLVFEDVVYWLSEEANEGVPL